MKGKQDAPFSCKNDFISGVNRWITWWLVTKCIEIVLEQQWRSLSSSFPPFQHHSFHAETKGNVFCFSFIYFSSLHNDMKEFSRPHPGPKAFVGAINLCWVQHTAPKGAALQHGGWLAHGTQTPGCPELCNHSGTWLLKLTTSSPCDQHLILGRGARGRGRWGPLLSPAHDPAAFPSCG